MIIVNRETSATVTPNRSQGTHTSQRWTPTTTDKHHFLGGTPFMYTHSTCYTCWLLLVISPDYSPPLGGDNQQYGYQQSPTNQHHQPVLVSELRVVDYHFEALIHARRNSVHFWYHVMISNWFLVADWRGIDVIIGGQSWATNSRDQSASN